MASSDPTVRAHWRRYFFALARRKGYPLEGEGSRGNRAAIARALGVNQSSINHWVDNPPAHDSAVRLARFFDVPVRQVKDAAEGVVDAGQDGRPILPGDPIFERLGEILHDPDADPELKAFAQQTRGAAEAALKLYDARGRHAS